MKKFKYIRASMNDLEVLINTRIKVLIAANKLDDSNDMSEIENQTRLYYTEKLENEMHIAYLVYDNEDVIGTGGVSFYHVMPTYCNPTGLKAYIMNMYTEPGYRRRGIAYQTLALLVKEAMDKGVTFISLEATEVGKPLYKKFGFVERQNEMIL